MILSGHQPCYLPGLQLFNKIMHSDAFMYVPHCQFQKGSWHHRNFIRTLKRPLTVPIHAKLGESIDEVRIDFSQPWQRKHIMAIQTAYGKAPFFDDYLPDLKYAIASADIHASLAEFNIRIMHWLTTWLRCDQYDRCTYSTANNREIRAIKDPVDMIIAMCKSVDADTYLSNEGARAYIGPEEERRMADAGITHRWQWFRTPDYHQGAEVNNGVLSVIDLLFYYGENAHDIIYHSGGFL